MNTGYISVSFEEFNHIIELIDEDPGEALRTIRSYEREFGIVIGYDGNGMDDFVIEARLMAYLALANTGSLHEHVDYIPPEAGDILDIPSGKLHGARPTERGLEILFEGGTEYLLDNYMSRLQKTLDNAVKRGKRGNRRRETIEPKEPERQLERKRENPKGKYDLSDEEIDGFFFEDELEERKSGGSSRSKGKMDSASRAAHERFQRRSRRNKKKRKRIEKLKKRKRRQEEGGGAGFETPSARLDREAREEAAEEFFKEELGIDLKKLKDL